MRHYFLIAFLSYNLIGYSQTFLTTGAHLNVTYRDLSTTGKTSEVMKTFFKFRRKEEKIALREKLYFGIGWDLTENLIVQTGLFYKRFGDVEEDEYASYFEETQSFQVGLEKIKHSYFYIGIPLSVDMYVFDYNDLSLGVRISPELNYLFATKYRVVDGENVIGNPIGYPSAFTSMSFWTFGTQFGILFRKDINDRVKLNANLLLDYHVTRDFERELVVNQRGFALGVNFGISYYLY